MDNPICILVVDDHAIVRRGLNTLIGSEPGMKIVGEAGDGEEALNKARSLQPDVILLDMMMPRKDGLQTIKEMKEAKIASRILVLTSFAEDDKVFPSIKAGALGYLLKDAAPDQLLQAIRDVHQGKSSLDPAIALKLIKELNRPATLPLTEDPLTAREAEVLKFVARGMTNSEIAHELQIRERTVGNHISNILSKLHLANRTQAALYALREGLVRLEDVPSSPSL